MEILNTVYYMVCGLVGLNILNTILLFFTRKVKINYKDIEKQKFEQEVPSFNETPSFEQPIPQVYPTQNTQTMPPNIPQNTYIPAVEQPHPKPTKWELKKQDPQWIAMMQERAAKMRASRQQKTQIQPQPMTEEQILLKRLNEIRGIK